MAPIEDVEYGCAPEGLVPGQVALRELDGLPFDVLVLRKRGDEADVLYLDDLNIEREVPLDELEQASEDQRKAWSPERLASLFEEGLTVLVNDNGADADTRPTTADTSMRWEQGRFVAADGSVFLSSCDGVLGTEAPKDEAPNDVRASSQSDCNGGYMQAPNEESYSACDTGYAQALKDDVPKACQKDEVLKAAHAASHSACGTGLRGIRCLRKNRPRAPQVV
jgi:hypothetical protein